MMVSRAACGSHGNYLIALVINQQATSYQGSHFDHMGNFFFLIKSQFIIAKFIVVVITHKLNYFLIKMILVTSGEAS